MLARDAFWKVLAVTVALVAGDVAPAAIARFHFVPVNGCTVQHVPYHGAPAEKITIFGRGPYECPPPPTCTVTFCHPYSGAKLAIPLALPDATPQMVHRRDRIMYNYGTYTVTVHFLPDGSVDVIYNSGLFKGI